MQCLKARKRQNQNLKMTILPLELTLIRVVQLNQNTENHQFYPNEIWRLLLNKALYTLVLNDMLMATPVYAAFPQSVVAVYQDVKYNWQQTEQRTKAVA